MWASKSPPNAIFLAEGRVGLKQREAGRFRRVPARDIPGRGSGWIETPIAAQIISQTAAIFLAEGRVGLKPDKRDISEFDSLRYSRPMAGLD